MKVSLVYCLIFLCLLNFKGSAQTSDRPNILWIVSEDNSPFIGAYGDEFATTPNIDHFATQGVRYTNAFATAPVCAPSRSTLITGMYPSSVGTEHMRSTYPVPSFVKFFPRYLREAGYYTTNNAKKDYNTVDQPEAWDESSNQATYRNRKPGQPFFAVFNIGISHESQVHNSIPLAGLKHDPKKVPIPPYHPRTPEMEHDWAQYYDRIQQMDAQVGRILKELDDSGLRENTIVFYYSDHGGVLGRSKRFMYESGLHIPLIIRFPRKYAALAPGKPGSTTDRIVTFVDFAPTILSLAGIPLPGYLQGEAFLGKQQGAPREYAFAFRGRMDERFDMVRSVRDKKFRYIRNFMPHKIYGQYLSYLWQAPSMGSWEDAWRKGELNDVQSAFWREKPSEELYDVTADPHNIRNLAADPQYRQILQRLRRANREWILRQKDVGFIPEPMMIEITKKQPLYDYARSGNYPLERILETAELASSKDPTVLAELKKRLTDKSPVVRYWAVIGCTVLPKEATDAEPALEALLKDREISVRTAAAEALYLINGKDRAMPSLGDALQSNNLMARVQALNVLENMGDDASSMTDDITRLLKDSIEDGDYDVRAAKRLLGKMAASWKWEHVSSTTGGLETPNEGNQQTATLVLDVDRDGLNDFFISERTKAPSLLLYRRTRSGWERYVIEKEALTIEAGSTFSDIDGDGDNDIVFGGDAQSNQVWWWENPYPHFDKTKGWQRRLIKDSGANKHHDQMFGDFDGDGEDELVFWNQNGSSLFLAEIPENPKQAKSWKFEPIYTWSNDSEMEQRGEYPAWRRTHEHEGLAKIDIDGDGKIDIVGGGRWFKHMKGLTYLTNVIDASYVFTRSAAGELISGGRPEVILVAGDGAAPMVMYEWQKGVWKSKILIESLRDGHSITLVDFDKDGYLDIFTAEMQLGKNPEPKTRILLGDGKGNFRELLVHTGFGLHESVLVDLTGDGLPDILGKPYTWQAPRLDVWINRGR